MAMTLSIELDGEDVGRWLADVPALPGTLCYGQTRQEAIAHVQALALRVLAEPRYWTPTLSTGVAPLQ